VRLDGPRPDGHRKKREKKKKEKKEGVQSGVPFEQIPNIVFLLVKRLFACGFAEKRTLHASSGSELCLDIA